MSLRINGRTVIALALAIIATISAVQTSGAVSRIVAADDSSHNNLSLPLSLTPTSTEPVTATGIVQVNLKTGQTRFELDQATPSSVYTTVFVSGASSLQLGLLTTNGGGNGSFETTMTTGAYAGIFQVTRVGVVQFVSAPTSFTIGLSVAVTASQTTTNETETTTTSTSNTTTSTILAEFQIEPALRSINAGDFAKFNINIRAPTTSTVILVAKGVPHRSVAIFTPYLGMADPEFHSTLTVVTAADTPAGTYGITVLAYLNNEQELTGQVALQINAKSTTTSQSTTTSIPAGASLSITISSDQSSYQPNSTVNLRGQVSDDTGSAVANAGVSVQVDGPAGVEIIFVTNLKTDNAGFFQVNFRLPANATAGTYTAFASTNKAEYASATTRTSFVVGSSSTPSVVIEEVYATDTAGNRAAVFTTGQTVVVWVVVENSGAPFQGVIWVQVRDPNGAPVSVQFQVTTLSTGGTVKAGIGFTLTSNSASGLYSVNALVSDKFISQGGIFLASADAQFAVTG